MQFVELLPMQSYVISNSTLLRWRVFAACAMTGYISWRIYANNGLYYFYFLTHWNWIINVIYFISGAVVAHRNQTNTLHKCLFAISNSVSWLVVLSFWILLIDAVVNPNRLLSNRIDAVVAHSMNLIIPLIDLFISTTTIDWIHALAPVAFVSVYSGMLLIVRSIYPSFDFPYGFLDIVNGRKTGLNYLNLIGFNCGLCLIMMIFFYLTMFLVSTRDKYQKPKPQELIEKV